MIAVIIALLAHFCWSFHPPILREHRNIIFDNSNWSLRAVPRYGPLGDHFNDQENEDQGNSFPAILEEFRSLALNVSTLENASLHAPSLLSKHIPLLLTKMSGPMGVKVVRTILEEAPNDSTRERISQAIDSILEFSQELSDQVKTIDTSYKDLLGKIMRTISASAEETTALEREEQLNKILSEESGVTPGFLRHIQGECERLSGAKVMSKETARLLQMMYVLQTRVLEELCRKQDCLGDAASFLGQLTGFKDNDERIAVLQASLIVRGQPFAKEMFRLTEEALEGLPKQLNVDTELVEVVEGLNHQLRRFLTDTK